MNIIYALCEPGTRTVRYIGKTVNLKHRLNEHLCRAKIEDKHVSRWIRKVVASGQRPAIVELSRVPEDGSWAEEEIRFIRAARVLGMRLTNGSDGGEGGVCPTPATLEKMRAAKSGPKNPNFGRVMSEQQRKTISDALKGRKLSAQHISRLRGPKKRI